MHRVAIWFYHPHRQWCRRHGFTCRDVCINPAYHLLPTCRLPDFKRAAVPAEAPAHGKIQVARIVGDGLQMHGAIMKHVAVHCPQELRLRVCTGTQGAEFFRPIAFAQNIFYGIIGLAFGQTIGLRSQIQYMNFLAHFLINAALAFLPQRALPD